MLGAVRNVNLSSPSRTDASIAVDRIKRALDEALALADRQGFAVVARRIAAAKVEILLTDLEGSKTRAMASLGVNGSRAADEKLARQAAEPRAVGA